MPEPAVTVFWQVDRWYGGLYGAGCTHPYEKDAALTPLLPSPPHADSGELVHGWVKKAKEQWGVSIEEKGTSGSFGPAGQL